MKKQYYFLVLLAIVALVSLTLYVQSSKLFNESSGLEKFWFDDFIFEDPRWNWGYNAGTGYKVLSTIDNYSVCEGVISSESTNSSYSDNSLHHFRNVGDAESIRVEIRIRFTDEAKGTKGCGWWDGSTWGDNLAWFCYFSNESDSAMSGFRCQVRQDGFWHLNQLINTDITQWHVYRIDLLADGTFFYIDDQLVASSPYRPHGISKLEGGWVDNGYVYVSGGSFGRGNLDLDIDEKMYIDWVRLSSP